MKFAELPDSVHRDSEQRRRIRRAASGEVKPLQIDRENQTAAFRASDGGTYAVTLDSCTCKDFSARRLPCKHIYRLAMECGVYKARFESIQIALEEAVAEIENLTDDEQIKLKSFLHTDSGSADVDTAAVLDADDVPGFLSCPLLTYAEASLSAVLEPKRKTEIVAAVRAVPDAPEIPKGILKADLILWCEKNVPQIRHTFPQKYEFSFASEFRSARKRALAYLRRKFDWDCRSDFDGRVNFPHGSRSEEWIYEHELNLGHDVSMNEPRDPDIYHFPNDEVTELLTLYGHNRCLNGFRAEKGTRAMPKRGCQKEKERNKNE